MELACINKDFDLSYQSNFIGCVIYISIKVEHLAKKELQEPLLEHILHYISITVM